MCKRLIKRPCALVAQSLRSCYQAFWVADESAFQLCGSKSAIRLTGCIAIRVSTSRNHANGSTPFRLHIAMKLIRIAAVRPPASLPKNVQLPRPIAIAYSGEGERHSGMMVNKIPG